MVSLMFVAFFVLLVTGMPIAFVLVLSTIAYMLATGDINWTLVPQRIFYGSNSFTMLCMPFFILAGNLMNQGGITMRLVRCAQAFVGHIRGGLAMVDVVVCMMFGTVSGSAVAGTSAVGYLLIPAMRKEGYDAPFAAGLTAVASTCAPIIPPSLAFVIYGSVVRTSVGDLFIAGIVPGILMGACMMVIVAVYANRRNYPQLERVPVMDRIKAAFNALPCIGLPVVVLVGIMSGWFTPTEAAAVAVIYSFLLSTLLYRSLTMKKTWQALINTGIDTAAIMLIVGASYLFGWVISNEQLPLRLTEALLAFDVPVYVKLLLINLGLLVVGMFMDSVPAILLVSPILAPAMLSLGLSPIQAGIVICMNLVIGLSTPPVGVCLYTATNIARCNFSDTVKASMPFTLASIFVLMLMTYVPFLSQVMFTFMGR